MKIVNYAGFREAARKRLAAMSESDLYRKQRVAIGRALIKKPDLFFADEPTSALDWEHGQQVLEVLTRAAHQEAATVLMVAHDPRVEAYADRILHLVDGALQEPAPSTPITTSKPAGEQREPARW